MLIFLRDPFREFGKVPENGLGGGSLIVDESADGPLIVLPKDDLLGDPWPFWLGVRQETWGGPLDRARSIDNVDGFLPNDPAPLRVPRSRLPPRSLPSMLGKSGDEPV